MEPLCMSYEHRNLKKNLLRLYCQTDHLSTKLFNLTSFSSSKISLGFPITSHCLSAVHSAVISRLLCAEAYHAGGATTAVHNKY